MNRCLVLCGCLVSSLAGCTETSSSAQDAGSFSYDARPATIDAAIDAAVDASLPVACTPSAPAVAPLGPIWAAFVSRGTPNNPGELWAVRVDSGQAEPAIKLSGPIVDDGTVQGSALDSILPFEWSADGRWLAYRASQDRRVTFELYVVDMSTSAPGPARKANGFMVDGGDVFDYVLSPDSSKLAYVSDEDVDNVRQLYVVDLTQATLVSQQVNGPFSSLDSNVQRFQWSFDSKHLAYVANEDHVDKIDLYLADVSGGTPSAPLKVTTLGEGEFLLPQFKWSPCSSTLGYVINTPPTSSELFLATIDQGLVLATTSPSPQTLINRDFQWVFDDCKISFRGASGVSILDVASSSISVISGSLSPLDPYLFSVDDAHIAMRTAADQLHVGPTDGAHPPTLLSENLIVFDSTWVPDSCSVVFRARTGPPGRVELYVSPLDGSPRRLSGDFSVDNDGHVLEPVRASPDASRLLYLADHEVQGAYELHMADVHNATIPNRRLNADITPGLSEPDGEVYSAEWSPDGTMVIYHATQDVGDRPDLYLVDVSLEPPGAPVLLNGGLVNTIGVSYYQWAPRGL